MKFSRRSSIRLSSCHPDLQRLFIAVVRNYDCTILVGHRGEQEQDNAFNQGKSKLKWSASKHNQVPSMAVDVVPYVPGKGVIFETRQCYDFAGYVKRVAEELGINLRRGADWDMDGDINDQNFNDICHFELKE